jgi:hypothetical protein
MSRSFVHSVVLFAALPVVPVVAYAQAAAPQQTIDGRLVSSQQPTDVAGSRRRVFAINPLGIPFEVVSVEFEAALNDAFSLAANFSYFSPDEYTRSSFEAKGRLYPNERGLRGFSVGLGLGAVNTRENVVEFDGTEVKMDETYPSIGVYVDYNWLLGKSDRFLVGTGVGAKRILGESDDFDQAPFVYGTARFLIGVAF